MRNFNWQFDTAHDLGKSTVHDTRDEAIAEARKVMLTDRSVRHTRASERAYREELVKESSRNPYLLENRYA